jgi:hypothetical protein
LIGDLDAEAAALRFHFGLLLACRARQAPMPRRLALVAAGGGVQRPRLFV